MLVRIVLTLARLKRADDREREAVDQTQGIGPIFKMTRGQERNASVLRLAGSAVS